LGAGVYRPFGLRRLVEAADSSGDIDSEDVMPSPRSILRTYLVLLLGSPLSASVMWGHQRDLLLDAGLSNLQALQAAPCRP
jgi:hypothetical protein